MARARTACSGRGKLTALHTLSAGVAHELRNPLSAMDLNLHLLEEELKEHGLPSDGRAHYLQVLNAECRRLSGILDNFMRFALPGSVGLHQVDVQRVIEHIVALMQFEAEERKICLERAIGKDLPPVQGDETQISQVLVNIVVNAFHAMANGGLCRIAAEAHTPTAHAGWTLLFGTQVSASRRTRWHGCSNPSIRQNPAVPALVSPLRIESCTIMVDPSGIQRAGYWHSRRAQVPCTCNRASGNRGVIVMTTGRILIVDDEINIRGALVTLLEKKGYQVRGVATGEEGLEQLEAATADLF